VTLFVDTSALVRRYVLEPGHDLVVDAMQANPVWVASAMARTEAMLTLHRIAAGPHQQARLWGAFRDDWDAFAVVPVDARCLARAVELGAQFALRAVDAVHLAAADRLPRPVRYLTFDRRQIPAAAGLGMEVVSPTD
jgi:predicted nucleic acid-binding protein